MRSRNKEKRNETMMRWNQRWRKRLWKKIRKWKGWQEQEEVNGDEEKE